MASSSMYQLVWQTRRLFQHLRVVSDEMLESTDINTSQRAVLEILFPKQVYSVPQIAQQLSVSRQHIQVIVNELQLLSLVKAVENPAHKRSPLIATTEAGTRLFEAIQKKEAELLEPIQKNFSKKDLATTLKTLKAFDDHLTSNEQERNQ